jgi:uncharacterized Zn finger protein
MVLPNLTLDTLQRYTTSQSYQRGEAYYRSGSVTSLIQRKHTLLAEVEGNDPTPYRITIDFDDGGIKTADCTCPYAYEGWCKHIVATLLTCIHKPETVVQRPTLAQLLDPLTLEQTQCLLQALVEQNPALIENIDYYVSQLVQPAPTQPKAFPAKRKTSIDPVIFKRKVKEIVRSVERYWDNGGEDDGSLDEDLRALITDAMAFAQRGDGANAMMALQGITEGCLEQWSGIYDISGLTPGEYGIDLDAVWAEAVLNTDLADGEDLEWQERFEVWQDELGSLAMALEALRQGWDYPPLILAMQGNCSEYGAWSAEAPTWADKFSQIRLKILQRQERYEAYLHLALAEGLIQEYLTMLGQLGRVEEAMTAAKEMLTTWVEAKALAEVLRSQNNLLQALQIALQGLHLNHEEAKAYGLFNFAIWTSDLAEGLGNSAAALETRIIAFKIQPEFKDYQKLEALTAKGWPALKTDLLNHLRSSNPGISRVAKVDIFLHEGLKEDAIASVKNAYDERLIWRVMDAIITTDGAWVIETAIPKANAIMNSGKADKYYLAVEWLKRVKAAYLALDKSEGWTNYVKEIEYSHGRKIKLMTLMAQNKLK